MIIKWIINIVFSLSTVSNSSGGDTTFRNEIQKPEQNETVQQTATCTQQKRRLRNTPVFDLMLFNWDQTNKRSVKMTAVKDGVFESFWPPFDPVCNPVLMQRFGTVPSGHLCFFFAFLTCAYLISSSYRIKDLSFRSKTPWLVCNLYNIKNN